jgi:hypothetical protein
MIFVGYEKRTDRIVGGMYWIACFLREGQSSFWSERSDLAVGADDHSQCHQVWSSRLLGDHHVPAEMGVVEKELPLDSRVNQS